jgi:hypothetical protein
VASDTILGILTSQQYRRTFHTWLAMLSDPSWKQFDQAHSAPTMAPRLFHRLGLLQITYIYRDPSTIFQPRIWSGGQRSTYSHLTDFETTMNFMMDYAAYGNRGQEKNILAPVMKTY